MGFVKILISTFIIGVCLLFLTILIDVVDIFEERWQEDVKLSAEKEYGNDKTIDVMYKLRKNFAVIKVNEGLYLIQHDDERTSILYKTPLRSNEAAHMIELLNLSI